MIHVTAKFSELAAQLTSAVQSGQMADQVTKTASFAPNAPLWISLIILGTLLITGILAVIREIRIEIEENRQKD